MDNELGDVQARMAKIENNIQIIGEIIITAVALAIGVCAGELVQNHASIQGYSWPAAIATGVVTGLALWALRSRLRY